MIPYFYVMMLTMFVITVIPITRGIAVDELSYFTGEVVPEGALVSVPLRGRKVPALVLSSIPARDAKVSIKTANFTLKRLERVEAKRCFTPGFLTAASKTAEYFAVTRGAVLRAVFPTQLLAALPQEEIKPSEPGDVRLPERFVVQSEDVERYALYKSLIRETFAKGGSIFFALPSVQDIDHVYETMERGIREYTFILHGGLSKKELEKRWKALATMDHPVLIIGTAYFLGVPRSDIATIIIDKESSSAYRIQGRPFIDLRFFAEKFAEASGAKFILGDIVLRAETFARYESGEFEPLTRPKSRLISNAQQILVDMRKLGEQPATGRFAIYSPTLVDAIEDNRTCGTQAFLLGIRKGFAPMTVCGDCGTVVECKRCSAPVVLHKRGGTKIAPTEGEPEQKENINNVFLCHRCGAERPADFTCTHCGGWRLTTLGIGIDQADEALRGRFPDLPVFRIDRDSVATHKEAQKIAEKFFATPGAVMIGTEMAIPYLTKPLAHIGVLSVNSLLTIPDFRMGEKVFRLLLTLRAKAERRFIVQTREAKNTIFSLALGGNIGEFLREELETRKELGYPPFATLIKLTHEGSKPEGERVMADIEKTFTHFHPVTFPAFIARIKGKYRMNALMKIPKEKWPDRDVISLLRSLPQDIEIRVDPESVI
jgi:primosomal protein N' (replication factor Y)